MCDIVEEVIHPIETKGISPNVVLTALDNSQFSVKLSTTEMARHLLSTTKNACRQLLTLIQI